MMSNLRTLIPGADLWPRFVRNRSERFEARFSQVEIQASPSLFFSGMEAWHDWKRTGYPDIKPGPAAFIATVPVRFMYPGSVQSLNGDNYKAAIARQGADAITTRVWWDVK